MLLASIFTGHPLSENVLLVITVVIVFSSILMHLLLFIFMALFPKDIRRELTSSKYFGSVFSAFTSEFPGNILAYVKLAVGCAGIKRHRRAFDNYPFEERCSKTVIVLGKMVTCLIFYICAPALIALMIWVIGDSKYLNWW